MTHLLLANVVETGTGCTLLLQETENRTKKEKGKKKDKIETSKQTKDSFQGNVYQGIKDHDPRERGKNAVSPTLVLRFPSCGAGRRSPERVGQTL